MRPVLALLALLLVPSVAFAWTDAGVKACRADVWVDAEGHARIALEVGLDVRAGWVERFELPGLDPDLALDELVPVTFVDAESGAVFHPEVVVREGGVVRLGFSRREAPRRGSYVVSLTYLTSLAGRGIERAREHEALVEDTMRVRWALPPFQTGIDGAVIRFHVPPGSDARPVRERGENEATTARSDAGDDEDVVTFERAHLPRTVSWSVAIDVSDETFPSLATELPQEALTKAPVVRESPLEDVPPFAIPIALALVAWLLRLASVAAHRARGLRSIPLLPLHEGLRFLALAAIAAGSGLLLASGAWSGLACLVGLVALASERGGKSDGEPIAYRFPTRGELRRARLSVALDPLLSRGPFDATRWVGAIACVALGLGLLALTRHARPHDDLTPLAIAFLAPIVLCATHRELAPSPLVELGRLAARARSSREVRALALELGENDDGTIVAARLRAVD